MSPSGANDASIHNGRSERGPKGGSAPGVQPGKRAATSNWVASRRRRWPVILASRSRFTSDDRAVMASRHSGPARTITALAACVATGSADESISYPTCWASRNAVSCARTDIAITSLARWRPLDFLRKPHQGLALADDDQEIAGPQYRPRLGCDADGIPAALERDHAQALPLGLDVADGSSLEATVGADPSFLDGDSGVVVGQGQFQEVDDGWAQDRCGHAYAAAVVRRQRLVSARQLEAPQPRLGLGTRVDADAGILFPGGQRDEDVVGIRRRGDHDRTGPADSGSVEHLVFDGGADGEGSPQSAQLLLARGVGVDDEHLRAAAGELPGDGTSEAAVAAHDDVALHVIRSSLHRSSPEDVAKLSLQHQLGARREEVECTADPAQDDQDREEAPRRRLRDQVAIADRRERDDGQIERVRSRQSLDEDVSRRSDRRDEGEHG